MGFKAALQSYVIMGLFSEGGEHHGVLLVKIFYMKYEQSRQFFKSMSDRKINVLSS